MSFLTNLLKHKVVRSKTNSDGSTSLVAGDIELTPQNVKGKTIAILGNSIVFYSACPNNSGLSGWSESAAKTVGNTVVPVHMRMDSHWPHLYYTCTVAGTTGTVEPTWPTTVGDTVVDGTVTWQATAIRSDIPQFGFGFWTMAQQLSGQRLREVYICGRSGKQSDIILQYVDEALDTGADVIFFSAMFENDCWPGAAPTISTIVTRWNALKTAMDRVRRLGKTVMLQTVFPNGSIDSASAFTTYSAGAGTKAWNWLNAKIREYAFTRPDVIFWDAALVYVDANPANPVYPENTTTYLSNTGSGQQLKKTDGVHHYTSAAYLSAKSLAAVITANFPAVNNFPHALDSYSFAPNPLNYGTAGTAGTGITSGTPANLMTMAAYGTVTTAALSKVARTDIAGEWQQSTYVATAGDNLSYGPTSSVNMGVDFAVGDVVQSFAEIKVLANPTLLGTVYHWLKLYSGGIPDTYSSVLPATTWQDLGQMITEDTLFTLKTPPVKIPASTASTNTFTRATGRGAANFTCQFGRVATVPVTIPDAS